MVPNHYSLTWDSHKSSICSGFSSLQQNGEFVDMTLAADGHLVKVHQVLIALASPYLKELISSVPAPHPVIFLNNVPHVILGLLLEYIYTGEVAVPAKHLKQFIEAAKALHIKGLESVNSNYYNNAKVPKTPDTASLTLVQSGVQRGTPLDINSVQTSYELPPAAMKVSVRAESHLSNIMSTVKDETSRTAKNEYQSYSDSVMDMPTVIDSDDDSRQIESLQTSNDPRNEMAHDNKTKSDDGTTQDPIQLEFKEKVSSNILQFTVSIRGSLQVILNRYMYNLQSASQEGVRRWRCIDYRNRKCPASLITKGNLVLKRSCLHSHSFHDKKILSKIEKNAVFSALDDVEGYKEKEKAKSEDEEWPIDSP